ncbi:hypothetical protein WMF27_45785 [Sorangium sp. So ce281]
MTRHQDSTYLGVSFSQPRLTAWFWGWNPHEQAGDGTREDRLVAVEILVA